MASEGLLRRRPPASTVPGVRGHRHEFRLIAAAGWIVCHDGRRACLLRDGLPFEVCISQGNHGRFTNISNIWLPLGGELEFFDYVFTGEVTSPLFAMGPPFMSGVVEVEVFGRTVSSEMGTFDTELLQLSLTGLSPLGQVLIRESPRCRRSGEPRSPTWEAASTIPH